MIIQLQQFQVNHLWLWEVIKQRFEFEETYSNNYLRILGSNEIIWDMPAWAYIVGSYYAFNVKKISLMISPAGLTTPIVGQTYDIETLKAMSIRSKYIIATPYGDYQNEAEEAIPTEVFGAYRDRTEAKHYTIYKICDHYEADLLIRNSKNNRVAIRGAHVHHYFTY